MFYFDDDGFTEKAGDYCYTLFILTQGRNNVYGFNFDEYEKVYNEIYSLFSDFEYAENHSDYSFKLAITENGLPYNSTICHNLKQLYFRSYNDNNGNIDFDIIAKYLTIKTRQTWKTVNVYGYCQGDIATVIYCEKYYTKKQAVIHGEIYNGWCKEFCLIDLDENGKEIEGTECYGFYVADSQSYPEENVKNVLCEMEGVKPEETRLLLIDTSSYRTVTTYDYTEV